MTGTPRPHPTGTWEPHPTRTAHPYPTGTYVPGPRPVLAFRPRLQFGHARPGERVVYHAGLMNRLAQDTTVDLTGESRGGWAIAVDPAQVVASPGMPNVISITVGVPMSPTHRVDIERVRAVAQGTPVTATTYLITLAGRRPFRDVAATDWADDAVQYLVDTGVMSGYADGSFRPNAYVTRAQFAKMIVGAQGWALQTPATPTFGDVPATYWAYAYIETAVAHGIMSGYANGTFGPNANLTRAQLTKMVATARGWSVPEMPPNPFRDVQSGDWLYSYAVMANTAEAMSGYADGTFRPNAPATRAQVAKILTLSLFSDPND
jgi:hypothetical protein